MSLSNTTRLHLLDPTVQNNSRCEFRLPPGFLVSSMKLLDVGVENPNLTDLTGQYYPSIAGVLACIRRIALYSNTLLIDEIQEIEAYGSVQHLRTTNQGSEDINRFELHNTCNLSNDINGRYTLQAQRKDYYNNRGTAQRSLNAIQIRKQDASALPGNSGSITLSDYLGFLADIQILPNLPDLRVVIEWNTTAADFYEDSTATPATKVYTPIRPTLAIEELLGYDLSANTLSQPLVFGQVIVERIAVPATTSGTTQTLSFRSGAFLQRYLKDVLFFNQVPTVNNVFMLAKQSSRVMDGEIIQLVVNGTKYLPDQGINQEAMKLQYFNDTFGPLNLPHVAYLPGITDASGNVIDTTSTPLVAGFSVTGVSIEKRIERLDIEYTRVGRTEATGAQVAAFNLLMFGKVARVLEMVNGKIRMSY